MRVDNFQLFLFLEFFVMSKISLFEVWIRLESLHLQMLYKHGSI